nr:DUF1702 family protein [Actinopolyspora righensis]
MLGALRKSVLAPRLAEVTFRGRDFPVASAGDFERLEAVPQTVVCGFEWALETSDLWEIERRLNMVDGELRGFAYEGATMAYTLLDAMPGGRSDRTKALLRGPGHRHVFLTYIGIGFAMARLPRRLWKNVVPDLDGSPYHPTMSWLAVDGYGFDRAYFDTHRWVDQQWVPAPYAWEGLPEYFLRAVDQGIGRALWFIHGGRIAAVVAAVRRFAEHRQADLWSGVGLAATFAGGAENLTDLLDAAGRHDVELALGAVFTAKARSYSEYIPDHSSKGVRALTGLSVAEAVGLADSTVVEEHVSTRLPAYEVWRDRIRAGFTSR